MPKIALITGGTGSFGKTMLDHLLKKGDAENDKGSHNVIKTGSRRSMIVPATGAVTRASSSRCRARSVLARARMTAASAFA